MVAKRVEAVSAELDALLAEPLEMLSPADQPALMDQWRRRSAAEPRFSIGWARRWPKPRSPN